MLTEPAFNLARLNLWKAQNLDAIRRRREDPQTMAALTFAKAFYAGPAVYTDSLMPGDLHKLDRALLLKAYGRLITPRGAILCVTGRIQEPELRDLLEKRLGTWGISSGSKPTAHKRMDAGVSLLNSAVSTDSDLIKTIPKPIFREVPGVYLVRAPFEQAAVVMGLPGPARDFPGYHSLSVFNRYFSSGGFSSVLFNEIRTKRGLAYSVGGGFAPGNGTGVFQIGLGTRVNQVSAAITEILTLITVARKETASTDLLREIKESIERGFVFNFATQAATLDREAARRLLGFPEDFDESFLAKVRAVTEENLLRVAVDYLDPSRFVIVVVGDIVKRNL
jgi:zinc protease